MAAVGLHTAECHGSDLDRVAQLEQRVATLTAQLEAQYDVQPTTGQGDAVFEWDVGLTKCFPSDAKPFEKDLHGGFNEDADTGIVYTGIPGYDTCRHMRQRVGVWKCGAVVAHGVQLVV